MNLISIIVPCYNEEQMLPQFYKETTQVLKTIKNTNYEFLFINDGSQDHTLSILQQLSKNDSHCNYYSFSRNFGKEAAMYAGLTYAKGDYCVIMDADLQHPPQLLPAMYHALAMEGYDCCGGKRVNRDGENKIRSFLSTCFYKVISKMSQFDMCDGNGDYRMMKRQMVDAILEMKEYNRYMKGLFSFVGFDTKWIEFPNIERAKGTSKWNLKSLFAYAFEGILSFSTAPITFAAIIAIFLILASFLLLITQISAFLLMHQPYSMSILIITLILFLSGVQMLFVYLLGEYTTKSYMESKKRPIYIIKESNQSQ